MLTCADMWGRLVPRNLSRHAEINGSSVHKGKGARKLTANGPGCGSQVSDVTIFSVIKQVQPTGDGDVIIKTGVFSRRKPKFILLTMSSKKKNK